MLLKYADDGDSGGPGLLSALGLLALGGAGGFLARRPLARALRGMRKKVKAQGLTDASEAAATAQPAAAAAAKPVQEAAAATKPVQEAAAATAAKPVQEVVDEAATNAVTEQVQKRRVPLRDRVKAGFGSARSAGSKLVNLGQRVVAGTRTGVAKARQAYAEKMPQAKQYIFGHTPEDTRSSFAKGKERVGNFFRGLVGKAPVDSSPKHVPGLIENTGTNIRKARARAEGILNNTIKPGAAKVRNLVNKGADTVKSYTTAEGKATRAADKTMAAAMAKADADFAKAQADWDKKFFLNRWFHPGSKPNLKQFQDQARVQAEAQIQATQAAAAQKPGLLQRFFSGKPQQSAAAATPPPQAAAKPAAQPVAQPQAQPTPQPASIGAKIKGGLGSMRQGLSNFGQSVGSRFGTVFGKQQ